MKKINIFIALLVTMQMHTKVMTKRAMLKDSRVQVIAAFKEREGSLHRFHAEAHNDKKPKKHSRKN
jgi:hypothetical protein